jgi:phage-related protein
VGLILYATGGGGEVVRDALRAEPKEVRAHVGAKIRAAQDVKFQLGKPQMENIKGEPYKGLRELRMSYDRQTYRLLVFHHGEDVIAVAFTGKKSPTLPKHVLETARERMLDWKKRNSEKAVR